MRSLWLRGIAMKTFIFIYNVVAIKANLYEVNFPQNSKFILIGSDYCIRKLSEKNKSFFNQIHRIERNFHQADVEAVEQILLTYLQENQPENIILLSNEDSTQFTCALLREKYGLPGNQTKKILPYVNKKISKEKLTSELTVPRHQLFNKSAYTNNRREYCRQLAHELKFPMFIKPIDLVSSIETYFIPDEQSLELVLMQIIHKPYEYEIDEFIQGDLYHCDLVLAEENTVFFMAGLYANPLAQFSKGKPMGSIPVADQSFLSDLQSYCEKIIHCLGRFSSAFHIEVFQRHETGEFVFLEAAARTPGALVPEMYELMYNNHLEKMHYEAQISPQELKPVYPTDKHAGWITYPQMSGTINEIIFPEIKIAHQLIQHVAPGDRIEQAASLLDSSCSVLFWDESHHRLTELFCALKKHQPLVLSEDNLE